ncbi:hypothetical protein EVC23_001 [Rhizobium phage RHph_N3_8]|uniref:hypothetical protein n=1 Tax=Rhizobium phage RHph_N3_8 TaxID=2509748 RepID=UPI001AFAF039|nr:hypothetical protein QEJ65_gp01 [Rhizobium phage RHph_N3_8]QIG76000.1 hypothetical protein EVC23_001 [Rhizobium phage RHph_N3_8]
MAKPKFKPGDTITSGTIYHQINAIIKNSYKLQNGNYMPINVVDKYWTNANEEEAEIIDEE